jgi:hypothetical protein
MICTELSPEESAALIAYARQQFAEELPARPYAQAGARGARQTRSETGAHAIATREAARAEPSRSTAEEAAVTASNPYRKYRIVLEPGTDRAQQMANPTCGEKGDARYPLCGESASADDPKLARQAAAA